MNQCTSHASTGGRCLKDEGHDGKHQAIGYPADAAPYLYTWDDDTERRHIDAESRKKLGT